MKEFIEAVVDIVSDFSNMEVREYSGRGMHGKSCLAVVGSLGEFAELMFYVGESLNGDDAQGVVDTVRQDSLGRDTVFYWPLVPFEVEDDE